MTNNIAELKYVPSMKIKDTEELKFSGEITLRKPTFDERYSYIEAAGFESDKDGNVTSAIKQITSLRKMVSLSKGHYLKVDITKNSDGSKFSSFDELSFEAECDEILIEISSLLISGISPSKK